MIIFPLKTTIVFCFFGILLLSSCEWSPDKTALSGRESGKPNIILIYTDDQGTLDMNCYGSKDLHTPNMDRLAGEGVRFTRFYASSPVCSPSRAALMTGKSPLKAGLADNASSQRGSGNGLPGSEKTMAEHLKERGYTTALIGKWHLGYREGMTPNDQGFDYHFGHMGGCIDNYSHYFYWAGPNVHDLYRNNEEVWYEGRFFPDLMAEEAASFIERNKEKPFFLYFAFNMPHYPLQGTEKWRDAYKDLPSPRKEYAAFLSTLDERIGLLLEQLDRLGLRENTIIVLQSDHGHSTEIRTMGGGGNAGDLRGCKFSLFEAGIRVPAIISWPGVIPQKETRDQMAANIDWLPTLIDYIDNKPVTGIEGKSLKTVIQENAPSPHETFCWQYAHMWAVRKGEWKLLYKPIDPVLHPDNPWQPLPGPDSLFLVNLEQDSSEQANLAGKHPEMVEELQRIFEAWVKN